MKEAARTSETLVNFYQTTRRYNTEGSRLLLFEKLYQKMSFHCSYTENLKNNSHVPTFFQLSCVSISQKSKFIMFRLQNSFYSPPSHRFYFKLQFIFKAKYHSTGSLQTHDFTSQVSSIPRYVWWMQWTGCWGRGEEERSMKRWTASG
jgi:hypothetical protein